jgi:hypothetical protein
MMLCRTHRRSSSSWTTHGPVRFTVPLGRPASRLTSVWTPKWTMQPLWFSLLDRRTHEGALFENHTIINVVPQGKFFCLLFTPRQSTWRCYKIDKMTNCVNISIHTMLHSHLRPQGSNVWALNSDQECIATKCKEDSTTWLVVWNLQKGSCHAFFKPMCMMWQMRV